MKELSQQEILEILESFTSHGVIEEQEFPSLAQYLYICLTKEQENPCKAMPKAWTFSVQPTERFIVLGEDHNDYSPMILAQAPGGERFLGSDGSIKGADCINGAYDFSILRDEDGDYIMKISDHHSRKVKVISKGFLMYTGGITLEGKDYNEILERVKTYFKEIKL